MTTATTTTLPSPNMSQLVAWSGSVMAVAGSLMLAARFEGSMWGWVLFVLSSVSLLCWALKERHYHQAMMQGIFLFTNMLGVYRWIVVG